MNISSDQFSYISISVIIGLAFSWVGLFFFLRKQPEVLRSLFGEGIFLRMITVVFIITSASMLALADKLSSEVSTILAGIAGFVLGGLKSTKKNSDN